MAIMFWNECNDEKALYVTRSVDACIDEIDATIDTVHANDNTRCVTQSTAHQLFAKIKSCEPWRTKPLLQPPAALERDGGIPLQILKKKEKDHRRLHQ